MRWSVFSGLFVGVVILSRCVYGGPQEDAAAVKASWPAAVRQALAFESAEPWHGGTVVASPRKGGAGALRWDTHTTNASLDWTEAPADLSAFNTMSFWLHSSHANSATFMIIVESKHKKEVFSYYSKKVTVDWTGWRQIEVHFRAFGRARSPVAWQKIDKIRFTASGWNQAPTDESVWVLDELDFRYNPVPYRPVIKVQKVLPEPAREEYLAKLRPGHPRLILLDEELPRLREFVTTDARGKVWYENARSKAESLYRKPPRKHELPDGRRLLSISRDVRDRMYHWGFMYRMEGDRKWLERAWQEMAAVVAFKDWNPYHYLDTAEMMHALGIGYDWFYSGLTDEQRSTIREGLWQHGLRLSYAAYTGLAAEGSQGWRGVSNNWNFVCNGGTSLAAMAVLDEMPEKCTEILHCAFQYIQIPVHHFEPDGAWWEGVGYWGYSMQYFLSYLRGLETAFGTDFGFAKALGKVGFAKAGDFPVYLVSPLGGIYNFADSGSGGSSYQHWGLFFLADRFRNPLYLYFQEQRTRGGLMDILYYRPFDSSLAIQQVALDKHFRETEVATMRGSWTDQNALFAGIKCGRNGIAHAHQDLGSFVLYGVGEKWLVDLGTERQTYLGHQHHLPKWQFYRIREEGHNTLVFNPGTKYCQEPKADSRIVRFESSPVEAFAIADLAQAYRQHAVSVKRGYRLLDQRRAFLVQDEIKIKEPVALWWFAHSSAGTQMKVSESGRSARLQRNGKTCHVRLLSPAAARLVAMAAQPLPSSPNPDIQNPNTGVQKLAVHLPGTGDVTVAVLFVPVCDTEGTPSLEVDVVPLASWALAADDAPRLSSITVDGEPLPDFAPDVFAATVWLAPDAVAVPTVTGVAATAGGEVQVTAPESLPGTATLTVTDPTADAASRYLVRFRRQVPRGGTDKPQFKPKPVTIDGVTVSASHHDGNEPVNVLDSDSQTRWSANGTEEWIAFDFARPRTMAAVQIAWFNGDKRRTRFKVSVSSDGKRWRNMFEGQSSGKSAELESYSFGDELSVRRLRITCYGNTDNLWNSMTEVGF